MEGPFAHTILSDGLTSIKGVIVEVTRGQVVDSHEKQAQDQGTHQCHPQGAVETKNKSEAPPHPGEAKSRL